MPSLFSSLQYAALEACAKGLESRDFAGVRRLSHILGAQLWFFLPSRRRLAIGNIRDRLGFGEREATELARESFNHNAMSFLEAVLVPRFTLNYPKLTLEPLVRDFQNDPRPIVASTGHMGAWELEAGILGELFVPPRPRLIVVRRYRNEAVNRLIFQLRGSRGAQIVGHREAVFTVLRALRQNGVAAFLIDHNTHRSEACFLPFLGKKAAVNMGPAVLAVRSKAVVWPGYLLRNNDGYVMHMEPCLDTTTLEGDRDANILATARFYTEAMERVVRQFPEQWFWMHNRWKTQPLTSAEKRSRD